LSARVALAPETQPKIDTRDLKEAKALLEQLAA
jgi:hypothetical protein